jgi:uncharacterized protein YuzE
MRFELDTEVNALYISLREIPESESGTVARTVELGTGACQEGVNLDIDSEGRILGLEFVNADDFGRFLAAHGGDLDLPERAENLEGFSIA